MMNKHTEFQNLELRDVHEYWKGEATDFTPWLKDNIKLLGEAIGIDDLDAEEIESGVGDFSLDILCRYGNDHVLIVENQLEKTDHKHLGQLLTYAAGKDAATVVWVSTDFRDEHRAAMDWLNRHTDDDIHFFGVQIEVWQIGSESAPKFNVICKPNEWVEAVKTSEGMTDLEKTHYKFWAGLRAYISEQNGQVKAASPPKRRWMSFFIGTSGVHMDAVVSIKSDWIRIRFVINMPHPEMSTRCFNFLRKDENKINEEFDSGAELDWRPLPEHKQCQIDLNWPDCGLEDEDNWPKLHGWLYKNLENFHRAFHQRLKDMKPEIDRWLIEHQPDDPDQ